ncbi:hypothetical protein SmB9_18470 [Sphingosinicella microcystinivorans]|uniref:Uncharacterized protein n=1 Tax=Sphingosinicella microcystinivorans TaxID=335406 RepID=A0AAD1D620_SPHMI|nr:hypothetical protein SmB9_18470 [Sphingosinicella microcystinivorans]
MPFHIVLERHPRRTLDDVARQSHTVVGVGANVAGREDAFGQSLAQHLAQRLGRDLANLDELARAVVEARGMMHQVPQRERLSLIGRDAEIEIAVDVSIKVELALLD